MNTYRAARENCLSRLQDEAVKELIAERAELLAALKSCLSAMRADRTAPSLQRRAAALIAKVEGGAE
jgi:hypothetical protein